MIKLSALRNRVPALTTPGVYEVGIQEATLTESSKTKNPMVKILLVILDGTGKPRQGIYDYFPLTDLEWKFIQFLESIQCLTDDADITQDWLDEAVCGASGWAEIGLDEYNGTKKNKVLKWLPAAGRESLYVKEDEFTEIAVK